MRRVAVLSHPRSSTESRPAQRPPFVGRETPAGYQLTDAPIRRHRSVVSGPCHSRVYALVAPCDPSERGVTDVFLELATCAKALPRGRRSARTKKRSSSIAVTSATVRTCRRTGDSTTGTNWR
jgi:hypothetical protein